jgi:hypothetical protein
VDGTGSGSYSIAYFALSVLYLQICYYSVSNSSSIIAMSETHPLSYLTGTGDSVSVVKRPGRKANHSPPPSPEDKNCMGLYLHLSHTSSWRST